jgi:hypothetical protein
MYVAAQRRTDMVTQVRSIVDHGDEDRQWRAIARSVCRTLVIRAIHISDGVDPKLVLDAMPEDRYRQPY